MLSLVQALEIDAPNIPRMATGFGAGAARCGELCGAVSGAILALGLKYGRESGQDVAAKEATYAKVSELVSRFEARFGCVRCADLIGCDLRTPDGVADWKARNVHVELCTKLVAFCAEEGLRLLEG